MYGNEAQTVKIDFRLERMRATTASSERDDDHGCERDEDDEATNDDTNVSIDTSSSSYPARVAIHWKEFQSQPRETKAEREDSFGFTRAPVPG